MSRSEQAIDDTAHVLVLLDSSDSESAEHVARLLDELRTSARDLPLVPALSSLAQSVSLTRAGTRLLLAAEPTRAQLDALLGYLLGP